MKPPPSTEERIWAILSHLSALAFGMGILLPILGWSEQRQKSKYASFQCLQALGYQSLGYTVWLLSYLLVLIGASVLVIVMSFRAEASPQDFDPFAGPLTAIIYLLAFGCLAVYVLLPVIASMACALGRDFRYPILGNRLAHYLAYQGYKSNDETTSLESDHEFRWVAAMGHFSVIIALWGLIAPVTAWIVQGRDNSYLKFQAVQTTLYQVFVTLLYVAAGVVYLAAITLLFVMFGLGGESLLDSSAGMAGLLLFFVTLLIAALIMLVVPLFHILGQWAGYRTLKGDEYQYPIIGRMVEKWMAKS